MKRKRYSKNNFQLTDVSHLEAPSTEDQTREELGQALFYLQITYVKMNSQLCSNKKIYMKRNVKAFKHF